MNKVKIRNPASRNYGLLNSIFYLYVLLFWIIKYYNKLQLHQLSQPALTYVGTDPLYWMLVSAGFPQFIATSEPLSIALDLIIFISAFAALIFQKKKLFNLIFTLAYFSYFLIFNTYIAHHFHSIGILFVSLLFLNKKGAKSLEKTFTFIRLYFFFMLFSAFLWKFFRANFMDLNYFSTILKDQHIYFFQANLSSWKAELIFYLIQSPKIAHAFWIGLMLLQASFCIGFFTKKYDNVFLVLYLVFLLGSWLFMNIVNLDNFIWILILLPYGYFQKNSRVSKEKI